MIDAIAVSGRTALLAILADPVAQAQSPMMINAALAARGHDAVLVPMHVPADRLAEVVAALRGIRNFRGAVVSMPHKIALVGLLDEVTPEARQVGACNVVRRAADGRLLGTMLDGEGFVAGLRRAGHEVRGKRVFLAGAGGAASAIAFAVGGHGAASLAIHNRTQARAEALAARVRAAYPALEVTTSGPCPDGHDVVVNATSLGMRDGDALPVDAAGLTRGMVAAEIVVQPATTAFLRAAAERGCTLQHGRPMLEAQIDLMVAFMLP